MLISLGLYVPVVIISKIPSHHRLVVNETNIYGILKTAAPDWWSLIMNQDEDKRQK